MMPRMGVVPILRVTDQQMPTGSMWNTASPMTHRKLYMPIQNVEMSAMERVPCSRSKAPASLKKLTSPMMLRKPRIRPPQIRAGMSGAKISPRTPMARWSGFWLAPAAAFAASLETPSMPETAVNS